MTVQRLRALLFDLDGTLLDSFPAHLSTFQATFRKFGISFTEDDFIRSYSPNWYHTYEVIGLRRDLWKEADHYWLEVARSHKPSLFSDVPGVLTELRHRFQLGLVTSGSKSRVLRDLERTGILHVFSTIVTGDDVREPKPSPEGLNIATGNLGLPPDQVIYIGDSEDDYEMSVAAGIRFLGVSSKFSGPGSRRSFQPFDSVQSIAASLLTQQP